MRDLIQLKKFKGLKIIAIKQLVSTARDRPDFTNKYLKILYFFMYEGVGSTLRKYFAHKISQERYLTFISVDYNSSAYLNISIQYQTDPSNFVVRNRFYKAADIDFEAIEKNLEYYLGLFNQFIGVETYEKLGIDTRSHITFDTVYEASSVRRHKNGLFIYGLGGYVRMFIMPYLKKMPKIACIDYKANVASEFKSKYKFEKSFLTASDSFDLLKTIEQPVAVIATYHSDHATIASNIFFSNPNTFIFIEKPPIVTLEDLIRLIEIYNRGAKIEIGFNRRFINYSKYVQKVVRNKVLIINCTIKEVNISDNHWYLWKNQGTRITGNVVHWVDLGTFWIQSIPTEINVLTNGTDQETSAISILYKNGSILNITASDKGNGLRGVQEKIEIRFDDETIFIDDFLSLSHTKKNGIKSKRYQFFREKGHKEMYRNFEKIVQHHRPSEYSVYDLINTSLVTYHASQMVAQSIRNMKIENYIDQYQKMVV